MFVHLLETTFRLPIVLEIAARADCNPVITVSNSQGPTADQ